MIISRVPPVAARPFRAAHRAGSDIRRSVAAPASVRQALAFLLEPLGRVIGVPETDQRDHLREEEGPEVRAATSQDQAVEPQVVRFGKFRI